MITGKLGNSYFRQVDGQTILSSAPNRTCEFSEKEVANHNRFGMLQELSSVVFNVEDLKKIWRNQYPKRRGLNTFFIQKHNGLFNSASDIPNIFISPATNFVIDPECVLYWGEENFLNLKIPVMNPAAGLNPNTENFIKAAGFFYLYNPVADMPPYSFSIIETEQAEVQYTNDIIFSLGQISPITGFYHSIASYHNVDVYIVLITLTDKDMPVKASQKMRLVLK